MRAIIFKLILLLLCGIPSALGQGISLGVFIMPQQSLYSYSNAFAEEQSFGIGLATGVIASYNATDFYGIEVQSLYSFETHNFDLPKETDFSGTNNYVKVAILNNFYSFAPSNKCRLVTGIGPQVSVLTQANTLQKATDKIINFYDSTAKVDVGFVGKLGLQISIKDALLNFGARYDRGFINITPKKQQGSVYNNTIGFYISIAANKGNW